MNPMIVNGVEPETGETLPELHEFTQESENWIIVNLGNHPWQYLLHFSDGDVHIKNTETGQIEIVAVDQLQKHERGLWNLYKYNADLFRKMNQTFTHQKLKK